MSPAQICFSCGKELVPIHISTPNQCDDAVMFTAYGNYGSTVFDPMNGNISLLINVCDECIVRNHNRIAVLKEIKPLPTFEHIPWNFDKE
jgi:hypothetical protein